MLATDLAWKALGCGEAVSLLQGHAGRLLHRPLYCCPRGSHTRAGTQRMSVYVAALRPKCQHLAGGADGTAGDDVPVRSHLHSIQNSE